MRIGQQLDIRIRELHICISNNVRYHYVEVKAITVKFLVWENTTRKELHPLELTSKTTTVFALHGTSKGLHKERYCRIDVIDEAVINEFNCIEQIYKRFQAPFGLN